MTKRERNQRRNQCVRARAHELLDEIWQSGMMDRTAAYEWLAYELGMPVKLCHLSKFDRRRCMKVIKVCSRLLGREVVVVRRNAEGIQYQTQG